MWRTEEPEFTVQPLLITPEIAARAKADQQGQAQWGEDTRGSAREHSPTTNAAEQVGGRSSETTTTNAAEQVEQLQVSSHCAAACRSTSVA
jgi:hypothetical protein